MKINWYYIVLKIMQVLIYIKRFVFWILGFVWAFILTINRAYLRTVGFYIYRTIERTKKKFHRFTVTKQQGVLDVLGRREVLQIVLLLVAVGVIFPHSRLHTKAYDEIAGRKTILYTLAGPGDQVYDLDEIVSGGDMLYISSNESWRQVAVSSGDAAALSVVGRTTPEITTVSVGGSALTKPILMPGVDYGLIDPTQTAPTSNRVEVLQYEVQPGDVLGTIATQFGLQVETILSANNLTARSYIRPGQKLTILPVDGVVHTVVKGDTLSKISRLYTANTEQIVDFNDLEESGSTLTLGDQLIVPGGIKPRPISVPTPVQTSVVVGKPDAISAITPPPPSVEAPAGVGYIWPTGATIITQYFGLRHTGVDIAGKQGLPIYATKAGTVITSQCGWNGGYGCYIKIDHGGGIVSWYGHASVMYVEVGDVVAQGETIALVGNTGRSTGPHLHFEIRVNNKYQNPLSYVRK